jgi:hypothetical protein
MSPSRIPPSRISELRTASLAISGERTASFDLRRAQRVRADLRRTDAVARNRCDSCGGTTERDEEAMLAATLPG